MTFFRMRWLPGALLGLTLLTALAEVILSAHNSQAGGYSLRDTVFAVAVFVPPIVFSAVGTFITTRQSGNPIGWLMIAIGVGFALAISTSDYPGVVEHGTHPARPLGAPIAWVSTWIGAVPLTSLFLLLVLFPTGKLPSRRWIPLVWLGLLAWIGVSVVSAIQLGPMDPSRIDNPLGIAVIPGAITGLLIVGGIVSMALAALSQVLRFRSSRGDVRQQLKWFTYGAVLAIAFNIGGFLTNWSSVPVIALWLVAVTALPVCIGLAILRYRLYDIDLLINRTLVYLSLTLSLGLLYLGSVLVLQGLARGLTGQSSDLAIALATLAVAALFNPWRGRLQIFIDRRFYRRRYDSVRTLSSLSSRLQHDPDLGAVRREILQVVDETMQPAHVSLWLQ